SMPGTCGSAPLRRTAWVVLMLTTALPWSSTRRVKSGSCACAAATVPKAISHRAAKPLIVCIICWFSRIVLLRTAELYRVGDALHAHRRRLADHGNHVIRDFASIDIYGADAGQPGAHRLAPAFQRLDEYRHSGEPVGIDHLPHRPRLAEPALELGD